MDIFFGSYGDIRSSGFGLMVKKFGPLVIIFWVVRIWSYVPVSLYSALFVTKLSLLLLL